MAEIVPIRRLGPEPELSAPSYAPLSQEAREAYAALRGRLNALDRVFSGPFCTTQAKAQVSALAHEIAQGAQRVGRLCK